MIGFILRVDWRLQEENGVLIFIAVTNMLSKPRRFGPLSSADPRMYNLSKFNCSEEYEEKHIVGHDGADRFDRVLQM